MGESVIYCITELFVNLGIPVLFTIIIYWFLKFFGWTK